jgi:hypothetical protein
VATWAHHLFCIYQGNNKELAKKINWKDLIHGASLFSHFPFPQPEEKSFNPSCQKHFGFGQFFVHAWAVS